MYTHMSPEEKKNEKWRNQWHIFRLVRQFHFLVFQRGVWCTPIQVNLPEYLIRFCFVIRYNTVSACCYLRYIRIFKIGCQCSLKCMPCWSSIQSSSFSVPTLTSLCPIYEYVWPARELTASTILTFARPEGYPNCIVI